MKKNAKDKITDALVQLLSTLPHTKITAKQIIETAGVNKSTYYYNFSGIEDIIQYLKDSFISEFEQQFTNGTMQGSTSGDAKILYDNAVHMYTYLYENRQAFSVLINSSIHNEFRYDFIHTLIQIYEQRIWKVVTPAGSYVALSQTEMAYNNSFQAYAQYAFLERWVKRNFEESPEELANIIAKLVDIRSEDYLLS